MFHFIEVTFTRLGFAVGDVLFISPIDLHTGNLVPSEAELRSDGTFRRWGGKSVGAQQVVLKARGSLPGIRH